MLIQGVRPGISGAEKKIIEWLRSSSIRAIPGLALSGQHVPQRKDPGRRYGPRSSEADLILITPDQLIVIEVKGQILPGSGVLFCPPSDRWKLEGHDEDPVHVRTSDRNPLDQVSALMYDLKHLAGKVTGDKIFVSAAVMIVPMDRFTVTLDVLPPPEGCDVLLADNPAVLEGLLQVSGRHKAVWTAGRVQKVLRALGVTSITYDDLVAEGFAADMGAGAPADLASSTSRSAVAGSLPSFPMPAALASRPPAGRVPMPPPMRRRVVEVKSEGMVPLGVMAAAALVILGAWLWYEDERAESAPPTSGVVETSEQQTPRVTVEPVLPCFPFDGGC